MFTVRHDEYAAVASFAAGALNAASAGKGAFSASRITKSSVAIVCVTASSVTVMPLHDSKSTCTSFASSPTNSWAAADSTAAVSLLAS